jgi:hypothetical protein
MTTSALTMTLMPLLHKINTTINNSTMNNHPLIIYEDSNIINKLNHPILLLILIYATFHFIVYFSYDLDKENINLENENNKLNEKLSKEKIENKKLKQKIIKLKQKIINLEEQNYHRVDGVRRSRRVINNKIQRENIEDITDEENETDNLTDSLKEIYRLYPGMRFDDERMYKYIKKHPKLKNSFGKTPINSMNYYLQKLRKENFLKRELVEGKYYYSE